ncbi:hypothetical protein F5Y18DRAFT_261441, partial [Xylariaceae sp. FL1019]
GSRLGFRIQSSTIPFTHYTILTSRTTLESHPTTSLPVNSTTMSRSMSYARIRARGLKGQELQVALSTIQREDLSLGINPEQSLKLATEQLINYGPFAGLIYGNLEQLTSPTAPTTLTRSAQLNPAAAPFRPASPPTPTRTPTQPVNGLTYGEAEVMLASDSDGLSEEERVKAMIDFFREDKRKINSDLAEFRRNAHAQGFKTLKDSRWAD